MTDPTTADQLPALCCGEDPIVVADKPLQPVCGLCPKSPTYWRNRPGAKARMETNPAALADVYRNA